MLATLLPLFTLFVVAAGLIRVFWPKLQRYRARGANLDEVEKRYESLRRARKDVVYHYYWSTDRGDWKEADQHEKHCEELDNELDDLRETFHHIESGGDFGTRSLID